MKRTNTSLTLVRACLSTLACCSALACGDLGDVEARAPLVVIDGQLSQASSSNAQPAANVRVAVIWTTSNDGYKSTYDVPATPIFPSKFRIELKDPPPQTAMIGYPSTSPAERPTVGRQTRPLTKEKRVAQGSNDPNGGFAMAIGSIVAYEDRNGNGRLDLVATGESPIDRVLGASDALALVYIEGDYVSPFNAEFSGTPSRGYNLLRSSACRAPKGASEPAPPCEPSSWIPTTTLFDLPLSAEPRFADMMCQSTSGMSSASPTTSNTRPGELPPAAPGPKGWPAKDTPDLVCAQDGKSYRLIKCESTSLGLCRGSHETCTEESWGLPSATPPPEWPCALK